MSFQATDDDLPDFFRDGRLPEQAQLDFQRQQTARMELHYPEILIKRHKKEFDRKNERAARSNVEDSRKHYVRLSRKVQMFTWLYSLERTFPAMRDAEQRFCGDLLARFRKYTPAKTKWITQKQYDWLKHIASTYLMLPNECTRSENLEIGEAENMGTLKEALDKRKGEGKPLLHGDDLGKLNSVTIKVADFREAPDTWSSIGVIDFSEKVCGKEAFAVNKTNMAVLKDKFGFDDDAEFSFMASKMRGKKLILNKYMGNNPQTKKIGPCLALA